MRFILFSSSNGGRGAGRFKSGAGGREHFFPFGISGTGEVEHADNTNRDIAIMTIFNRDIVDYLFVDDPLLTPNVIHGSHVFADDFLVCGQDSLVLVNGSTDRFRLPDSRLFIQLCFFGVREFLGNVPTAPESSSQRTRYQPNYPSPSCEHRQHLAKKPTNESPHHSVSIRYQK